MASKHWVMDSKYILSIPKLCAWKIQQSQDSYSVTVKMLESGVKEEIMNSPLTWESIKDESNANFSGKYFVNI